MGMSEQNQPEKKKNFQHHMAVPGKKGIIYTIARGIFWIYFHLFCFMHCTGREKLNLDGQRQRRKTADAPAHDSR